MKQRLTLFGYTTTPDGMGGTTTTDVEIGGLWGNLKPVTGNERWEIESLKGTISHTLRIRYRTDITNENWFTYDGRKFYVKYAFNDGEDRAYTTLALTEEQND
jgi:SPP1 family predicted phage head-tail adaptor